MQSPLITLFSDQRCDPIFIDKSKMISYLNQQMEAKRRFHCVTMPSRFGKTYLADMVAAYYTNSGDSHSAFKGLIIESDPSYEKHLNRHNLIKLDIAGICALRGEAECLSKILEAIDKRIASLFPGEDFPRLDPSNAICALNERLGATFVFVIDEWDYLLRNRPENIALFDSYIGLLRSLFKNSMTKPAIDLCYMTGIMPIKRYGTMSALNEFAEYTMLEPDALAPYYGFLEENVREVMRQSKTVLTLEELKEWYDGYRFPAVGEVYCPNSVVKACAKNKCGGYFADSMADSAVTSSLRNNHISLSAESAVLLEGGRIKIRKPNSFGDISNLDTPDKGLIALVHSGFLLFDEESSTVAIPNKEVKEKFLSAIETLKWETTLARAQSVGAMFLDALSSGETKKAASLLGAIHYPLAGPFHHGSEDNFAVCMRALLFADPRYSVLSETYMGFGRADLVCLPMGKNSQGCPAIVLELKVNKDAETASAQIKDRAYSSSLKGFEGNILEVGIDYDVESKTHEIKISHA